MNDECADKIADNRYSIEHSREWLADDGGVMDRVHRMSAKTVRSSSSSSFILGFQMFLVY